MPKNIEHSGLFMVDRGGSTHPGSFHLTEDHYKQEISLFSDVLDNIKSNNPAMIELGSFWAFWSLLFRKRFPGGKNILVELGSAQLSVGLENFELNGFSTPSHYHGGICIRSSNTKNVDKGKELNLLEIIDENKVEVLDLLHMDIQGSELNLLKKYKSLFSGLLVKNVVVCTHGDSFTPCRNFLSSCGYLIVHQYPKLDDDGFIYARLDS